MGSVFTFTVAQWWHFFFLLVETDYDSVLESGQHLSRAQSQSSKEKMGNSTFAYCTNHIHSLPSL